MRKRRLVSLEKKVAMAKKDFEHYRKMASQGGYSPHLERMRENACVKYQTAKRELHVGS